MAAKKRVRTAAGLRRALKRRAKKIARRNAARKAWRTRKRLYGKSGRKCS